MRYSLRVHLLFFHVLTVLICLGAAPWVVSVIMGSQFDLYMEERVTEEQQELVDALRDAYIAERGWNLFRVADIARQTLRGPLVGLLLSDNSGKLVWSAWRRGMQTMPHRGRHGVALDMVKRTVPIVVNGFEVGKIDFMSLPVPEGKEARFLESFNNYMLPSVLGILVIAGVLSFIFAARRITEIENLSRTLEEQEKLRKRLMSDVAHELRTPVTIIKAQLEAMSDGVILPDKIGYSACISEADRLTRLIANVENLANIEGDSLVLNRKKCDISELLGGMFDSFTLLFRDGEISFDKKIVPDLFAKVDRDKMKQVFENLLSNALRYTERGGAVELSAERTGNKITACVRDNGIGIDERDLPHIFERFYRADASRAHATGGRGLGLAIAKAIVSAHGGTITAQKNHPKGSVFTVEIFAS